jgi:alkylhydroperoxidase family enzyme
VLGIDPAVVQAVLADWRTAPVDDRLRATLGYLEKLTLTPELLDSRDIAQMRAAGLSDQAIYDAAYVCFLFSIIDRLADAFEFTIPEAKLVAGNGRFLNRFGYTTNKFMP